jgi:hypothetical protein
VSVLTRLIAAISLFACEMQVATWSSVGTVRSLFFLNVAVLIVAIAIGRSRGDRHGTAGVGYQLQADHIAVIALGILVLGLNITLPMQGADPYHLERVAQIERLGTLAYDPSVADPKVNVLGWAYELVLADIDLIPLIGQALLRLQGVFGLALYLIAVAAARTWFPGGRAWCRAALLVIPVVFQQFVLVKNDLFGAVPALVALAWLVARGPRAETKEIVWAAWLTGFAVAVKLTSVPLALVFMIALLVDRPDRLRILGVTAAGGIIGAVCGGLAFTMVENARWYGDPIAVHEAGGLYNRNGSIDRMVTGVVRFAISLFDLGLVTRRVWPGRGGWGSTFGLPMVWALVVLALRYRTVPDARRALWIAGGYFLVFSAVYTDADIAHRLALAPGVLLIVSAMSMSDGDDQLSRYLRLALAIVMALSTVQVLRSAYLYLSLS